VNDGLKIQLLVNTLSCYPLSECVDSSQSRGDATSCGTSGVNHNNDEHLARVSWTTVFKLLHL